MEAEKTDRAPKNGSQEMSPWAAYVLAGEIGYTIAIPALLFGFGGAYLDRFLATTPVFIIAGLLLAGLVSWRLLWRVIRRVVEMDRKIPVSQKAIEAGERWRREDQIQKEKDGDRAML